MTCLRTGGNLAFGGEFNMEKSKKDQMTYLSFNGTTLRGRGTLRSGKTREIYFSIGNFGARFFLAGVLLLLIMVSASYI